ncbi:hypothetical protein [Deinococcus sp. JMULE3]|uniref:hypothetical protein n=1 Tax=Deinococcus sp. JMULE3 TaxID=2518341 RepID=UPI0015767B3B|nr:hypothetical protein [Deinococcus sp. JMULE3]NTX99462.1 hypothetical protein [Deinococcus sp. JMULE3]
MTVAAFAHPYNITQSVLVCRAAHLSATLQTKIARLAARDGYQIVLVGPYPPELQQGLGTPTPGFTPEAPAASLVTVPSTQHALAHLRASTRNVLVINPSPDAISACAATLTRTADFAHRTQPVTPAA